MFHVSAHAKLDTNKSWVDYFNNCQTFMSHGNEETKDWKPTAQQIKYFSLFLIKNTVSSSVPFLAGVSRKRKIDADDDGRMDIVGKTQTRSLEEKKTFELFALSTRFVPHCFFAVAVYLLI